MKATTSPLLLTVLLAAAAPMAAHARSVKCAIDPITEAHQCIDPLELRETDGIRWAPLYSGGPKDIDRTTFTVHANCRTTVLHLKDRQGVSFGGGRFHDTAMSKQLGALLCDTPLPAPKRK
jgi:hypothetical protein